MQNFKKAAKEIRSWIFSILGALFIALFINSKVFANAEVQQSSMESTLFSEQYLIVDKFSYNFSEPKRGDIIIFLKNEEKGSIIDETLRNIDSIISKLKDNKEAKASHSRLVKRVIGIEGDEIDIKDGYVYLNGSKLKEPYVKGDTFIREFSLPVKVGHNQLFVLGDNRPVSEDSRSFGLIDINQVEGKAVFRVYPFEEMGRVK